MLVLMLLTTASANECESAWHQPRQWCHFDVQAGVGTFFGGTTEGAGFGALAMDARSDIIFPRANIGLHLTLGPSLRSYFVDGTPFLGMYMAETVYWQHGPWGFGVGIEAPNAMLAFIKEDSPEFVGLPMVEVWRNVDDHIVVTARVGTGWGRNAYGSVGLTWDGFRIADDGSGRL